MIDEHSTLEDVCFEVSAALADCAITAVLTGGSAAAVYSPHDYMSLDADFVLDNDDPLDNVAGALESIGFHRQGRSRIFSHDRSGYTVDFPKGPLAVGGDYIRESNVLRRGSMRLRLLTRTDSIRDRLSHFYYWDDYTALNAAVAVASQTEDLDVDYLRNWTVRESTNFLAKFEEFLQRVSANRNS